MLWPSGNSQGRLGVDEPVGSGSNYPFLLGTVAREFVEDLKISTDLDFGHELLLLSIDGVGQSPGDQVPARVHGVDLQVGDRDRGVLFDTRTWQAESWTWQGPVSIHRWQQGSTVIEAAIRHSPELKTGYWIQDGVLDDRILFQYRQPVSGLEFMISATRVWQPVPLDPPPRIREGFNVTLETGRLVSDRGELVNELVLDVVPGLGAGRAPACNQQLGITALAGATPNQIGNLTLSGSDCIGIRPWIEFGEDQATVRPGEFLIYDICEPACTCDDFSNVANYVIRSWNKFVTLAARVKELQASYREARDLYVALRDCSRNQPMKVHVWRAGPESIGVGVSVCNLNDSCLAAPVIRVQVANQHGAPVIDTAPSSYTNNQVAGRQMLQKIPAGWSGGAYRTQLGELATGHKGFLFVRYRIGSEVADQSGLVQVELFGVGGPAWDNKRVVTVPYS
jgi:hypothetical protein